MNIDKRIIEEITRYRNINRYIQEQDAGLTPAGQEPSVPGALAPPPGGVQSPPDPSTNVTPPPPPGGESTYLPEPEPIDVEADDDVTEINDDGKSVEGDESGTTELDITDLVDTQKKIGSKQEEYFDTLFKQLSNLETKLGEMDALMNRIDNLDQKFEKYREKTPEEKLELRSFDSYPFNQKLTDFFDDKKVEMEKTGKNEYVLTSDEVTNINPSEIKDSFNFNSDVENSVDGYEYPRHRR